MGLAPQAIHGSGTVQHLAAGASTGMNPAAFLDTLSFIEELIEEKTGRRIPIPLDKKGAEILLVHNSGEYLSWPENPAAMAILFDAAGLDWTLSSAAMGYEAVNYGVWYDDVQFARIAIRQIEAAKKLGVKKIVIGECGHASKALVTIADRLGRADIPRESCLPLLEKIAGSGRLTFDPARNDFPVTLHDPCNLVRLMGIVAPQRNILRRILPAGRFREMPQAGLDNYCCGGGSGMAVIERAKLPPMAKQRLRAEEGGAGVAGVPGLPRPENTQVLLCSLFQLQRRGAGEPDGSLPFQTAVQHHVWRSERADGERPQRSAPPLYHLGKRFLSGAQNGRRHSEQGA